LPEGRCDHLVGGDDFAPSLWYQDGRLGRIVIRDHRRNPACCPKLTSLAPDLIREIERLASQAGDTAPDCDLFAIIEGLLIIKLKPCQNDSVRTSQRLLEHLGKIDATGSLRPDHIGGVVYMLQHVNIAERDLEAGYASKVSQCHAS